MEVSDSVRYLCLFVWTEVSVLFFLKFSKKLYY